MRRRRVQPAPRVRVSGQAVPLAAPSRHPRGDRGYGTGVMLTLLLFLLAVLGMAWVYSGMVAHDRWPVRWLEVHGEFERVSPEQLRAGLAPLVAGSYFTVNPAAVAAAAERIPWVARAEVRKAWPDTVHVVVAEFTPVAHWDDGGEPGQMLAADGRVFTVPGGEAMQGLPRLAGPPAQREEVFGQWRRFDRALAPIGREIDRLAHDRRGAWSLVLDNGTTVELGREDAPARLERLVRTWPQLRQRPAGVPVRVDARYTNGIAVQWPEPPAEEVSETGLAWTERE